MNVTCERCNTEYDFDDTLVSGRGTTVKCTNCGHLFKVRKKSADPAAAPEKWVVRTVDGRELQFNALRELQGLRPAGLAQGDPRNAAAEHAAEPVVRRVAKEKQGRGHEGSGVRTRHASASCPRPGDRLGRSGGSAPALPRP